MTGTDKLNGSPVLPFYISRHVRVVRNLLNDATPVYAAQYIKVNINHKDYPALWAQLTPIVGQQTVNEIHNLLRFLGGKM